MSAFPVKNFREALEDTKLLQSKLSKSFVIECKRHNMVWIEGITKELFKIFSTKENVKLKVNAMYGIQYFVELAEYPMMTLFEVYILPTVLEIALFRSPDQTFESTSQYFVSQGYSPNTPNIKELSHNYVMLAQTFIFNCASIKFYRTFESNEMNEQSQYKKAALKLNKAGIKERDTNPDEVQQIQISRQNFIKNLNKFDNDSQYYVSYYMKKIEAYIMEGSKYHEALDFKKIMKYGDVFLTSEAIGHCCEALENNNFEFKKNALLLIHDFVVWGDIEAIMMINYSEYIEEIFNCISEVNGEQGLNAGEEIYPEVYGEKELKKNFYIEFLKCLQTWAMAIPKTNFDGVKSTTEEDQEFSPVFLLYIKLKNEKQFKFPENALLPKQKKELEESLIINRERNNLILRQLEENAEDTLSMSKRSSLKPLNKFEKYKSKNSLIKEQRESEFVTSSEIQKYIKSAQNLMEELLESVESNNIDDAEEIMQKLNEFCHNFESKLEIIDESIDEEQLENLYREGINRIEIINCINDHFEDFKSEKINLMKLEELIKYELSKRLSEHTESRYLEDYKSRRSKRSSMSRSFGLSQNLFHSKDRSLELKNFSHDKYRIPVDNSKHAMSKIAENLTEKESQSEVSKSTDRNKKKIQGNTKKEEDEDDEAEVSYDFEVQDYGFADAPPVQQNFYSKRESNKESLKSSRKSIEEEQSKQSLNQLKSNRTSQKSNNIYTDNEKVEKIQSSNANLSEASIQHEKSRQSISNNSVKSQNRNSEHSQKELEKEQNFLNEKISNSQSNFAKSKKLTEKSESFMIASDNLKKLNEVSNLHSDLEHNPSVYHKKSSIKVDPNQSESLGHNPHKVFTSADPRELTSFNITQIAGFSKAPPSSVNKISSIEQKKFKFEMFNSQEREIFEDELSKHSQNYEHKKLKEELEEDENPGFGMVFKNKSNLKSDKVEQFTKLKSNLETYGENRSKLSENRRSSKENSQIKDSKKVPILIRASREEKIPLVERSQEKSQEKSFRKSEVFNTSIQQGNIYTNTTQPKRESLRRKEEFSDSSLNKSEVSRKSLRKSERGSLIKNNLQGQALTERVSESNYPGVLKNNEFQNGPNVMNANVVTIRSTNKVREEFNQSSFINSSQDTPRILQRSKNYYDDESYSEENSNLPIYLQKNTSPKNEKISFANSSKHNVLSKLAISEKDEKEEYDKSNLTPSEYRKSNQNTQNKFYEKDQESNNREKLKSLLEEEKGLKSKLEGHSSEIKKKIQSSQHVQFLANKELEEIRILKERLEKIENESKHLLEFQKSTTESPEIPRYAVTPRSPKFRENNSSLSIEARQRVSFTNSSDFMSPQTKRNFDLNSSYSRQYLITPQGKLIKKSNYERYFHQLRLQPNNEKHIKNPKKRLLRNKELTHKNDAIEIGITILRERNRLKIIYFITPELPIQKFSLIIDPSRKLRLKCSQNEILDMKPKSQYKVYVNCEIIEFPYLMPNVEFMYKNEKKTFYLGKGSSVIVPETKIEMLLPVYFIKFIEIVQISSPELSDLIQGRPVFRTEEFPLNPKFIKKSNQIHDYIPNLGLLSETAAMTTYYGKGSFFNHNFIFKIYFKMNHFVYIQGIPLEDNEKYKLCQNIIEWFMVCLEELFIKEITQNR